MKMIHLIRLIILTGCLLISGCGSGAEFASARMQWEAARPENYTITVRHTRSVWHSQDITVTVKGGVTDHSARCTPAPTENGICAVEAYDPADYTVEGLFSNVEGWLGRVDNNSMTVRYNEQYGYPELIRFDDPDMIDEDVSWSVIAFSSQD